MRRGYVIGSGGIGLLAAGLFLAVTQNRPDPMAFAKPWSKSETRSYVHIKYASGKPDSYDEQRHLLMDSRNFEICQSWFFLHGDPSWTKPKEPTLIGIGSTFSSSYERLRSREFLTFASFPSDLSYSRELSEKEILVVRLLHPFKDPFVLVEEEDRGVKIP